MFVDALLDGVAEVLLDWDAEVLLDGDAEVLLDGDADVLPGGVAEVLLDGDVALSDPTQLPHLVPTACRLCCHNFNPGSTKGSFTSAKKLRFSIIFFPIVNIHQIH